MRWYEVITGRVKTKKKKSDLCIKCRVLPVFHIYLGRHDIVFMPSHKPGHMKNLLMSYIVRAMALFESYPQAC